MRKKDDGLHQTILNLAREIANKDGTDAVNIRVIARQAGIATGTVYNYFSSKEDILLALTEEFWQDTLVEIGQQIEDGPFYRQIEQIYAFLSMKIGESGGMLMGSLGSAEASGRERMESMHQALGKILMACMEKDPAVWADMWSTTFTKRQFADFVTRNMVLLLRMKEADIRFFVEIVKRTLY